MGKLTGRLSAALVVVGFVVGLVGPLWVLDSWVVAQASMYPTFGTGDRVLTDSVVFHWTGLHRGDVVVLDPPDSWPLDGPVIKRVVATGGQVVEIRDGVTYVDGDPVAEPWLADGWAGPDLGPVRVPDGQVFVAGDNRAVSLDSRWFGPVPVSAVRGKVLSVPVPVGFARP